jgi:hypothetical protein
MITGIAVNATVGAFTLVGAVLDPNLAAYGGLIVALIAAFQSARITGPNRRKILAEAGGAADRRILEWGDRVTAENAALRRREQWLEGRVDQLEQCMRDAGIAVPPAPPAPN